MMSHKEAIEEGCVTGDVLRNLIVQGWMVTTATQDDCSTHKCIYRMTLQNDNQHMVLRVQDNPFVRTIVGYVAQNPVF
jgi:hypothetical protein